MDKDLFDSLWALIEPVLEPEGVELVEIEFTQEGGRWILRIYIDAQGGVNLDDCEAISRQVSALLDIHDPIRHRYNLEISSPGINRVLRREKDFISYAGSPVRIRTRNKLQGRRNFKGLLRGVTDSKVVVDIDGQEFEIHPADIDKARLDLPDSEIFGRTSPKGAATARD